MVERRTLLTGGVAAGVGALLAADPAPAAAAAQDGSDDGARVARAIDELRASIERQAALTPALTRVRDQQHVFLKANQKFPDFVEVGIGVWEAIHDWQVANRQTPTMTRLDDGRYVMTVMFTTLILRPEQRDDFIGFAFDAARA